MGIRIGLGVAAFAVGIAGSAFAAPTLKALPPKTQAPAPAASAAEKPTPPGASAAAAAPGASAAAAAGSAAPGASANPDEKGDKGKGDEGKGDKDRPWAKMTKLEDRLDALRAKLEDRKKTLEQRRTADRERVQVRWGGVAAFPAVREELRLHAMRTARLQRIEELAEVENKTAVEERAKKAMEKENARHERRMTALASNPGAAAPAGGAR